MKAFKTNNNSLSPTRILSQLLLLVILIKGAESTDLSDPRSVEYKHDALKFLFFGTSRSYGTLLTMNERKILSFPYLLSKNATNLSIPAGTSIYPSLCVYSMIDKEFGQEDAFDVIVIEFLPHPPKIHAATVKLANRLKHRYPMARILFLNTWLLGMYNHISSNESLNSWAIRHDLVTVGKTHPIVAHFELDFLNKVQELTDEKEWKYSDLYLYSGTFLSELESIGIVIQPISPSLHTAVKYFDQFAPDMHHFSRLGHAAVAKLIRENLQDFRTHHDSTLQPWKLVDFCETWMLTGQTLLTRSDNLVMNQFNPHKQKYALEAKSNSTWINIVNPGTKPLELSLEHMATSPDCLYPETNIIVQGTAIRETINPCKDLGYGEREVHVTHTTKIGSLEPGTHTVSIEQMSDGRWPFRLVGLALTAPLLDSHSPFENIGFYHHQHIEKEIEKQKISSQ